MWMYIHRNCIKQRWISSHKPSNWVDLDATIASWSLSLKGETYIIENPAYKKNKIYFGINDFSIAIAHGKSIVGNRW
jgi:hypothetical protein